MTDQSPVERARNLGIWRGRVEPQPLGGGITNVNFLVEDCGARYVVRVGDDIPIHQIMRFNERAASEAAYRAGISPQVVHSGPGVMVMRYVEGTTLSPERVREPDNLIRILPLLKRVHVEMPRYLRGPTLAFWVFHIIRDYAHTLTESGSPHATRLPELLDIAASLEAAISPVDVVLGHNDLLAGNFIDDGTRIWLIDWDYAGFNSPLFDLSNLASNNVLAPAEEEWMLSVYFGRPPDTALRRRYQAMKCASLLREATWSMVSEIHSRIDFDYAAYTRDYLDRFERAHAQYLAGTA